jgi:hypothetical protein
MNILRSVWVRRIIYAMALALALTRLGSRSHAEPSALANVELPTTVSLAAQADEGSRQYSASQGAGRLE